MKRTIFISIIASSIIFGANVNDLTTDIINKTQNSSITNANIEQGKTEILHNSTVDGLTVTQKGEDGSAGNLIDNLTVNGTEINSIDINQGTTSISDASVTQTEINSISAIDGGAVEGIGEISQGKTEVLSGGRVDKMNIESTNRINGADISGESSQFLVSQGSVRVSNDANASDSSADNIDIKSNNLIESGVSIADSSVKQSSVEIDGAGTFASGLNINQTNTIDGSSDIRDSSKALQGVVKVDTGARVDGLSTNVQNSMHNLSADNSVAVQNHINIHSNSEVTNMDVETIGNHNLMTDTELYDSNVTQNTFNIVDSSSVSNLSSLHDNSINNSTLNSSSISQDLVDISSSTLDGTTTLISTNKIDNLDTTSNDNVVNQSVTVIKNTNLSDSSIVSNNEINNVSATSSEIAQNYVSFENSNISGLALNNTNSVINSDATSHTLNSSTISQAEVTINSSDVSALSQNSENMVADTTSAGTYIAQAKINILNSTIGDGGVSIEADNFISTQTQNSYISQNGLAICDSSVDNLSITQNNRIEGGSIDDSTLSQGDINIAGEIPCEPLDRATPESKTF